MIKIYITKNGWLAKLTENDRKKIQPMTQLKVYMYALFSYKNTQMFLIFWHCSPLPSSLLCAVMHIQVVSAHQYYNPGI